MLKFLALWVVANDPRRSVLLPITFLADALFVLAAPEAEFLEHDSAVWSLDVQPEGNFAISGAEDGMTSPATVIFIFALLEKKTSSCY